MARMLWIIMRSLLVCLCYLDMEFKVLIHGVNVVEDVLSDARNDALTL